MECIFNKALNLISNGLKFFQLGGRALTEWQQSVQYEFIVAASNTTWKLKKD